MVLIIILVHPVSPDELKIAEAATEKLAHDPQCFRIDSIIHRISFRHTDHSAVFNVRGFDKTERFQLTLTQLNQVRILHSPQPVALEAEVFQPQARELAVRHHLGRPGAEVLDAANLDAGLVDVDPVVGEQIGLVDDQRHGEEVAITQVLGGRLAGRQWADARHQLADRRRGDDVARRERLPLPLGRDDADGPHAEPLIPAQALEPRAHVDAAAALLDLGRRRVPHHAGALAGILE